MAGFSPEDFDYAVRTVWGEARGENPFGQQAVAHVIRNRANKSGQSIRDTVLAKNQFEPWGARRSQLEALKPDSPEYQRIAETIRPVFYENTGDPTSGATHFYSPKAQTALGRKPPSWDDGSGVDIGRHRFFALGSFPGAAPSPSRVMPTSVLAKDVPTLTLPSAGKPPMADPTTDFTTIGLSPEEVARRRQLANQAYTAGSDISPVGHWTQALARAVQGMNAGVWGGQAQAGEAQGKAAASSALMSALTSADPARAVAGAMAPGANPYVSEAMGPMASKLIMRNIEENSPDARRRRERDEFVFGEEKAAAPWKRRALEADVRSKEQKDVMDEFFSSILTGRTPPPATAPSPGVKPMSETLPPPEGAAPAPSGVIKVADPAPAAAPVPAKPRGMAEIIKSRSLEEQQLLAMLYKTDKKKAAELLQQWVEPKLSAGSQHDLEKSIAGLTTMRAGLSEVAGQFKPEYMKMYPRLGMAFNSWKAKLAGGQSLTPEEQTQLANFEKFRSSSFGVLNTRLKELAGTAVTESEMKRILREIPNPGTGVMDGDDPITFKAKMDQTIKMANLGIARMYYMRKNGFGGDVNEAEKAMPLDAVPKKMDEIGTEKFRKLKSEHPKIPDAQLFEIAKRETAKEFGLDI